MKSLILLHGALGCSEQFNQLYSLLQDKYEVYKFDFSGHGKNSDNVEFTIDRFTDDLHAFIKDREIQSTAIFGYSMGGYVALNLALKHADHIQKIITFGTKFDWNPEVAENEILNLQKQVKKWFKS